MHKVFKNVGGDFERNVLVVKARCVDELRKVERTKSFKWSVGFEQFQNVKPIIEVFSRKKRTLLKRKVRVEGA